MADPVTSSRSNPPRTEISLRGVTTEEVRGWALNVMSENPIASGGLSTRWPDGAELETTDYPFMGVELTFVAAGQAVHTIAIFAEVPTDDERAVMDEQRSGLRAL